MKAEENNIQSLHLDEDYSLWLAELKSRYHNAQLKAAVKVNSEKLQYNWQLGAELVMKKAEERWGAGIVEQLSRDMQNAFPKAEGFTARNLWHMKQWYLFYSNPENEQKLKQTVSQFEEYKNTHPYAIRQIGSLDADEKLKQPVSVLPSPFAFIGWGHHIAIIQKCKDIDEALYYILKTIENNWSREALKRAISIILKLLLLIILTRHL